VSSQDTGLMQYYDRFISGYKNTINYFFTCTNDHKKLIRPKFNKLLSEAIKETVCEFENLQGFTINTDEITDMILEMESAYHKKIDIKPERYVIQDQAGVLDWNEKNFEMTMHEINDSRALYIIENDEIGYSYEKIFGPYFDEARNILIEDPFVWEEYQIQNLIRFCNIAMNFCKPEKIKLITTDPGKLNVEEKFRKIKENLKSHNIEFEFEYKEFHYRRFSFDNGWIIGLDRGLDIYKFINWYSLEYNDLDLRPCRRTEVKVMHDLNFVNSHFSKNGFNLNPAPPNLVSVQSSG
jgi:hypothetical protein